VPGFANFKELVETERDVSRYASWRKAPNVIGTQGIWFDLSMSPGNPKPNYYASTPLAAARLAQSTDGGIFHGGNVSPSSKFLRKMTAITNNATGMPMPMILCDYLLYYPFVDEGETAEQLMDNTTTLSRYTTGEGVRMMAVSVGAHSLAAGVTFQVKYTNSVGASSRYSQVCTLTRAQSVNGTILTSERNVAGSTGLFIPLQAGDTGVRSVESVTMLGTDVGLFTIVLVKPLAQLSIRGVDAPVELDYFLQAGGGMPKIEDDAYLNFVVNPQTTISGVVFFGDATFTWK
jgi:hypothetical protein